MTALVLAAAVWAPSVPLAFAALADAAASSPGLAGFIGALVGGLAGSTPIYTRRTRDIAREEIDAHAAACRGRSPGQ